MLFAFIFISACDAYYCLIAGQETPAGSAVAEMEYFKIR